MALIKCPECEQSVSTSSDCCPHCGYKLTQEDIEKGVEVVTGEANAAPIQQTEQKPDEDTGTGGGGFLLGLFLGLFGLLIALVVAKKSTKGGALAGFIVQAFIGLIIFFVFK